MNEAGVAALFSPRSGKETSAHSFRTLYLGRADLRERSGTLPEALRKISYKDNFLLQELLILLSNQGIFTS